MPSKLTLITHTFLTKSVACTLTLKSRRKFKLVLIYRYIIFYFTLSCINKNKRQAFRVWNLWHWATIRLFRLLTRQKNCLSLKMCSKMTEAAWYVSILTRPSSLGLLLAYKVSFCRGQRYLWIFVCRFWAMLFIGLIKCKNIVSYFKLFRVFLY